MANPEAHAEAEDHEYFQSPSITIIQRSTSGLKSWNSDIVTVLVGPEEAAFKVHKEKICHASLFFQGCFRNPLIESTNNLVTLPEDDPFAFQLVVEWAYGVRHKVETSKDNDIQGIAMQLVDAYVLADKLCMEAACNYFIDLLKCITNWIPLHYTVLQGHRRCSIPESPLRTFLVQQLAYDTIQNFSGSNISCAVKKELFQARGADAWDVFKMVLLLLPDRSQTIEVDDGAAEWVPPCLRRDCEFHVHRQTPKCT